MSTNWANCAVYAQVAACCLTISDLAMAKPTMAPATLVILEGICKKLSHQKQKKNCPVRRVMI